MDSSLIDVYWQHSPSAGMILENFPARLVLRRTNLSCQDLLGYADDELTNRDDWEDLLFTEKVKAKFNKFISNPDKKHVTLTVRTSKKKDLDLRFLKRFLGAERRYTILSLHDLTEIQENSRAMQAGYDEFIRVTTDLEAALSTIEKQKKLLEDQKRILEKELEIAHRVQAHMFHQDFSEFQIVKAAGFYQAMTNLGGDMWEFHETEREFLGVLGDVMGHGVAASLISISSKTLFKKRFEEYRYFSQGLGRFCRDINRDIVEITNKNYFITVCLIKIDRNFRMEFITAGHPPIILIPADPAEGHQLLFTEQPMLGIFSDVNYESQYHQLIPGDRVIIYTDCLIESTDPDGNQLTINQIADVVHRGERTQPGEIITDILDFHKRFTKSDNLQDDLAVVCLDVPAVSGSPKQTKKRLMPESKLVF